ncbi:hypothetical protein [Pseudorhodoferax sp. Leaf274]|uniref:hypothetical protein n=1 Tax=Pseudorhodoferax sp. Leaf274 TaxID=1736318 RepID=UPI0007034122|nr:hypothetical protein [Pseudorhodoferax sp. Leaf274]KQP37543.1 hypothetical protein ASF44_14450 [Pseudorhodoferax sp. Leaf274]
MTGLVRYEKVAGFLEFVGRSLVYRKLTGLIRIFRPGALPGDPYIGAGTVVWRQPHFGQPQDQCEIRGLKAEMNRAHWRDMAAEMQREGAARVWALRGPGKLLPYAKTDPLQPGWQYIDLADIKANPAAPVTGFVELPD